VGVGTKVCAGILDNLRGCEQSRNRVVVPARHATQVDEVDSLESILGSLKV
jgi:hypothetical protein